MSDMGFLVSDTLNELFWLELLLAKGIFSPVPDGSRGDFRLVVAGCWDVAMGVVGRLL